MYLSIDQAMRRFSVGILLSAVAAAVVAYFVVVVSRSSVVEQQNDLGFGSMFDRIADHYDIANRVMSLGLDRGWRVRMVGALELVSTDVALDLATGTADVALLEGRVSRRVLGVDPSEKMLAVGRKKIAAAKLDDSIRLEVGDATSLLALQNETFDKISMAFGIRNVPNLDAALSEMRRVAKDNATLVILEFAMPEDNILAPVARFFINHLVPRIGALLSGAKWTEYRHLQESIAKFPKPHDFANIMRHNKWDVSHIEFLAFGSVALYLAHPLLPPEDESLK